VFMSVIKHGIYSSDLHSPLLTIQLATHA
ncbi:hypothetical protein CCACVL1_00178, partial [Corchorus capsularis]